MRNGGVVWSKVRRLFRGAGSKFDSDVGFEKVMITRETCGVGCKDLVDCGQPFGSGCKLVQRLKPAWVYSEGRIRRSSKGVVVKYCRMLAAISIEHCVSGAPMFVMPYTLSQNCNHSNGSCTNCDQHSGGGCLSL